MECTLCEQSYVGYTTGNLPRRLSNHKNHIKKNIKSCKLVNHFLDFDHKLDFSSTKSFDASLSKFLKVILIDSLIFDPKDTQTMKEKACEIR